MAKTKVLYVLHNHPVVFPGGAEMYALELFEALRGSDEIEPVLVARADLRQARERGLYTGATFKTVEGDPQQYFMFTEFEEFDPVLGTSAVEVALHPGLRELPARPAAGRRALPAHAHDRLRHRDDDAARASAGADPLHAARVPPDLPARGADDPHREEGERALHARVAEALQRVLPGDLHGEQFFLRERFIKSHLANVDLFLSPEPVPAPALHRVGNTGRADQVRGAGAPAHVPARRARGGAAAQPARRSSGS